MLSRGRVGAVGVVALGVGFVGGAWFIGSGYGFQLIPVPAVPPVPTVPERGLPPSPAVGVGVGVGSPFPGVQPVGLPEPARFSGGSAGLMPKADRADLLPSPGCSWEVEPRPFRTTPPWAPGGGGWLKTDPERAIAGYPLPDPRGGDFRYLLVQSARKGGAAVELRPVLLDDDGNRMIPSRGSFSASAGGDGQFSMTEFHFDGLYFFAKASVAFFGVERVRPEAAKLLAEAAQEEAREEGVAILPDPKLGEPYPFDIPDVDGRPVRAGDFRGRAVLVAVWGPQGLGLSTLTMAKELRKSFKESELAIVNVSFHESAERAKEVSARNGPGGPLIAIPNDPGLRRLWRDGSGIARLPECFLVDREGILRSVGGNPFGLKNEVDVLLGRAPRPFSPMIFPHRSTSRAAPKAQVAPSMLPGAAGVRRPGGR